MDISTGINNFLSTLSGYISEEDIQKFKNKNMLSEMGFSFLDASNFENFNQFKPVDIETVQNEVLEAWESLKESESGLSSAKESGLLANIKETENTVNTQEFKQISQEVIDSSISSWTEAMNTIKSTIESQMQQNEAFIQEFISAHSAILDQIKSMWEEGQQKLSEQVTSDPENVEGINTLYEEMLAELKATWTEAETSLKGMFENQSNVQTENQTVIQNLWNEAVAEFKNNMGNSQ